MALTQAAERAALNKLIDYLDEDPKAHIDKIMALVDRLVPESVLTSQRGPSTPRSASATTGTAS